MRNRLAMHLSNSAIYTDNIDLNEIIRKLADMCIILINVIEDYLALLMWLLLNKANDM